MKIARVMWIKKTKMHSAVKAEGPLNFTFLCIKLSVPFSDKNFIYRFDVTRFL